MYDGDIQRRPRFGYRTVASAADDRQMGLLGLAEGLAARHGLF